MRTHAAAPPRPGAAPAPPAEASFELLFAHNPLPMWVYDLETLRFLEVNTAAVTHYGYTRDEFLQMDITGIRPPTTVPALLAEVAQPRPDHQRSGPWQHQRKDGQVRDVEIISHVLTWAGRPAALVVVEDITARRRVEAQVQRQVQQLTALRTIDLAITASHDLRITLHILLSEVLAQLQVDAAAIWQLNLQTLRLEYAAGRGFRTVTSAQADLRLGQGLAGRVARERRRVSVADLAGAPDLVRQALVEAEGFRTYSGVPLVVKGQIHGVLEVFDRTSRAPDAEWFEFLDALAGQTAIALENATLFTDLQQANLDLMQAYEETLEGWARALELRDVGTEGHTMRVVDLTVRLGQALGLPDALLVQLRRGALLHDIGKIGVPDAILQKPGPLTEDEWVIMRRHPVYAYQWLAAIPFLRPALDIPYCHHERWDGAGYPRGLQGEQIPLAARIFAVVDIWDALISDRPYRSAWPEARVREHLRALAGTHCDPQVVAAFLALPL